MENVTLEGKVTAAREEAGWRADRDSGMATYQKHAGTRCGATAIFWQPDSLMHL